MSSVCSLYGEFAHEKLPKLLERLIGLCGDTSHCGLDKFCEHDVCFVPCCKKRKMLGLSH